MTDYAPMMAGHLQKGENMIFHSFGKYRRIDKRVARRLYDAGEDVLFIPCNMRPDNMWGLGMNLNKDDWSNENRSFDDVVMYFEWYNCNNETGRYTAFYKEVK